MKTFSEWWKLTEAAQGYSVTFRGVDGTHTQKFPNLAAAARYVKERDQGSDYRRGWGLQDDYGQFFFNGFTWNDIMDGDQYKHELVSQAPRVSWRTEKITSPSAVYESATYMYADGDKQGVIFKDKPREHAHPLAFEADFPYPNARKRQRFATLEEAKKWMVQTFMADLNEKHPVPVSQQQPKPGDEDFDDDSYNEPPWA